MSDKHISAFADEVIQIMPQLIRGTIRRQPDAGSLGNVTVLQYLSLDLLDHHESLKMKEIALHLSVSLPAASGLINRLFSTNLVERIYDKKDRRVIYIRLTPKGKKMVDKVRFQRRKAVIEMFGKLTQKERSQYLNILKRLLKTLYPQNQ
ncbi:MAG: MarR family transcriptional regulator [Candidatus Omnitrophica bacterium]|nr:MarR family transcriptional regulator [Candidatus Omnitrophota bacterium]